MRYNWQQRNFKYLVLLFRLFYLYILDKMVFEQFNNKNELNKSNMNSIGEDPLSLIQGNHYNKNIHSIKGKPTFSEKFPGVILEGMTTKAKLDEINKKEKKWLVDNRGKVDTAMGKYTDQYDAMMREHLLLTQKVTECKSNCLSTYPADVQDSANKRKACLAGCDLKGPYILQCKDTYTGKKSKPSEKCEHLINGKCDSGNILLGNEEFVERVDNYDANNTSLKIGCCECGGGGGGKPTSEVNGNKIRSCDDPDLKTALGGFDGQNYCHNAPYPQADRAHNLYKKYNKVTEKNKELEKHALNIWQKVLKLEDINKKVKANTVAEEESLAKNLLTFREMQAKIAKQGLSSQEAGGDATIDAQLQEGKLLTPSEKFKLMGWSILGVSLMILIIATLRKELPKTN